MQIDIAVDFQWIDDEGLTLGLARHARAGVNLNSGEYVIAGDGNSEPSIARIVECTPTGLLRLQVFARRRLGLPPVCEEDVSRHQLSRSFYESIRPASLRPAVTTLPSSHEG
jgi:hypothetical protein